MKIGLILLGLVALATSSPSAEEVLRERMNRFAADYNQLARGLEQGVFDVGLARQCSRDWKRIESGGEWPREK